MAATNRPFGLAPLRVGGASPNNLQTTRYRIPSTDSTSAYYIGDPVKAAAGADTAGVPNVAKCAAGDAMRGVIVGIENPTVGAASIQGTVKDLTVVNIPVTKARDYYVLVLDDPNMIFMAQDDGTTAAKTVAASANLNADIVVAAPSATYQQSATAIDSNTFATTNTLALKAMGLAQLPAIPGGGANAFAIYAVWAVRINKHELTGSFVGI